MPVIYINNDDIRLNSSSSDKVVVTGNLGVGTTVPQGKLTVKGATDYNLNIGILGSFAGIYVYNDASTAYKELRIDAAPIILNSYSGANVGIGTSSPSVKLQIQTATSNDSSVEGLRLYNAGGAVGAGVKIGLGVGAAYSEKAYLRTDIISGGAGRLFIGVNGSDRVLIDNNGNVGIGTTSPSQKLHVEGGSETIALITTPANSGISRLTVGIDRGLQGGIAIIADKDNGEAIIQTSNSSWWPMIFKVRGSDGTNERMRIANTGNVGIGTTAPTTKLHVPDGEISTEVFSFSAINGITPVNSVYLAAPRADNAAIFTSNTERVTIGGSGNVGIGTTSPTATLDVAGEIAIRGGESADDARMYFRASDNSNRFTIETDLDGTTNNDLLIFRAASTDNILVLKGNGNVGIGTTSPIYKLHVAGSTYVNGGTLFIDSGEYLRWGNSNQGIRGVNDTSLEFVSGGSERMRITNTGNVGIGTTSPGVKLQVVSENLGGTAGDQSIQSFFFNNNGNTSFLEIKDVRTSTGADWTFAAKRIQMRIDSTYMGYVQFNGTGNNAGISFGAGTTTTAPGNVSERMRITEGGNVGIGTTAPSRKLTVSNPANGDVALFTNTIDADLLINLTSGVTLLTPSTGTLAFGTSLTEKMRITAAGNVGIGTTSPDVKLHVFTTSNSDQEQLRLTVSPADTSGAKPKAILGFYTPAETNLSNYTSGRITSKFDTSGYANSRVTIESLNSSGAFIETLTAKNGNVGIGTTAPESKLHVASGDVLISNGQYYTAESNTGGNYKLAGLTSGNVIVIGAIDYTTAGTIFAGGDSVSITTGGVAGSTRVYINSSGNVGIGTTSPTNKLHVNGGSIFNQDGFLYMSNQFPIVWGAAVSIEGDNVAGTLTLKTESSHRIFINNVGNVGVGTTSPTNRLTVTTATNAVDVLRLNNTGGDSGSVQGVTHLAINHFNSGTNPSTRITAYQDSTSGWPGGMYFSTRSLNTDSAPVERMRITSGGNVGIGTTSPQYMLDVNGDAQINAQGTGPAYAYVPDGGFGLDSLITSGVENVALGKPDVWLRIHVDGVAFVFPGYQEP